MALGYAAGLMLLWPRLAPHRIGPCRRRDAALTNYLGTTILMTAIFSGWGPGLAGWMPRGWLPLFIPLAGPRCCAGRKHGLPATARDRSKPSGAR
jgi:uncharacterized protein